MSRSSAFREREESSANGSVMDSILGIGFSIACGILLSIFVQLVNQ